MRGGTPARWHLWRSSPPPWCRSFASDACHVGISSKFRLKFGAIRTHSLSEPSLPLRHCGFLWRSWGRCAVVQSAGVVWWWGRLAISDPGPLSGGLHPTLLWASHVPPNLPPSLSLSHTHMHSLPFKFNFGLRFCFVLENFNVIVWERFIKWLKGNNWQQHQLGWHYTYIRKYKIHTPLNTIYYLHFHWLNCVWC